MTEESLNELFRAIDQSFITGTSNHIIKTIVYNHLKDNLTPISSNQIPLITNDKDNTEM